MNARRKEYRIDLEIRQIPDAVSCIFHSLLLHRCAPKFVYTSDKHFKLGTIGVKEVTCEHIDLDYVRANSEELSLKLDEEVRAFYADVKREAIVRGKKPYETLIGMEFYNKKKKQWFYTSDEIVPWEIFNFYLNVFETSDDELSAMRETTAEAISDIILSICATINKPQFLPKMPDRKELGDIFDTNYSDIQPYLFKITRPTKPGTTSTLNTVRKLMKDTLYI